MLSFREVHVNGTTAPLSVYVGPTDVYVPPPVLGGPTDGTGPTGGESDASPQATGSLFLVATCPADLQPGQAVTAASQGSVAIADCRGPEAVIGICTRKRSDNQAVVQTAGEVVLGLSGLSPGVDYFLGQAGAIVPPPVTGVPFVQRIGIATSPTSLYINVNGTVVRQIST